MQPDAIPLLHTRLMRPQPRQRNVARTRLLARLADPEADCLLLSAPAGFGKTTLLTAWCAACAAADGPAVAWLTLEADDNEPARFLAYLHAALAAIDVPLDPPVLSGVLPAPAIEPLLTRLLNALEAHQRALMIVLDDYHVIHAPEVHRAVAFVLNHPLPGLRLAISSRADPPLPLARLRAAGRLLELRAADLRFTPAEMTDFFLHHGLSLPAAEHADVAAWLDGWPAGAQLLALALGAPGAPAPGDPPTPISTAALRTGLIGSQTHLFAYLADEVFAGQPAHRKAFLLETSILDQLCGPLCDAVLGIAPEPTASDSYSRLILDELDHANLFVLPVDPARRWFRYHPLFRAFLRERLERERPDDQAALQRRASAWYVQEGQYAPAVAHALAAGDPAWAADLIALGAAEMLARGEYATLRGWLDHVPEPIADRRPELWIWRAWTAFLSGAIEQVEPALQRAARAWPTAEQRRYAGQAAHLRAHVACLRGDAAGAIAAATEALAVLPADQPILRAGSMLALGIGQLLAGDPATAEPTLIAALEACRNHNRLGELAALRALGDLERMAGRSAAAVERYRAVLAAETPQGCERWAAQAGLAAIQAMEGAWAEALELLTTALLHAEQAGLAVYLAEAYLTLAQVQAALGRRADAEAALFQAERHARRLGAVALLSRIEHEAQCLAHGLGGANGRLARAVGAPAVEPLSERELEVLGLVALGASNHAVAERLVISVGTVKSHLSRILSKLDAQSRTEAVARARALGIIR